MTNIISVSRAIAEGVTPRDLRLIAFWHEEWAQEYRQRKATVEARHHDKLAVQILDRADEIEGR